MECNWTDRMHTQSDNLYIASNALNSLSFIILTMKHMCMHVQRERMTYHVCTCVHIDRMEYDSLNSWFLFVLCLLCAFVSIMYIPYCMHPNNLSITIKFTPHSNDVYLSKLDRLFRRLLNVTTTMQNEIYVWNDRGK